MSSGTAGRPVRGSRSGARAPGRGHPPRPDVEPPGDAGERRRRWGQNFFGSARDAALFAGQVSVPAGETVVDLGAGSGRITRALADAGHPVIAVEIDEHWAGELRRMALPGVRVVVADATVWTPEETPAPLVGNLPFGTGTEILRHTLEQGPQVLCEAVFLLQQEYVRKRTGRWGQNLFNVQWLPWFDFAEGTAFRRTTFRPVPRADTSTLIVRPRAEPLVEWSRRTAYQEMAVAVFGTGKPLLQDAVRGGLGRAGARAVTRAGLSPGAVVTHLPLEQWAALFAAHDDRPAGGGRDATRSRPDSGRRAGRPSGRPRRRR